MDFSTVTMSKIKLGVVIVGTGIFVLFITNQLLHPRIRKLMFGGAGEQEEQEQGVGIQGDFYSAVAATLYNAAAQLGQPHSNLGVGGGGGGGGGVGGVSGEIKQKWIKQLLNETDLDWGYKLQGQDPWRRAAKWLTPQHVHPADAPELGAVLREMATRQITSVMPGRNGSQLKLELILKGGQRVMFKPRRYARDYVVSGPVYGGSDRHNGEIAAFHLNRLLGYRQSPLVVGRVLDLDTEVLPVIGDPQLAETFYHLGRHTCFYGICQHCRGQDTGVCANFTRLEGSLTLWLPDTWQTESLYYPWARTYNDTKARWQLKDNHCEMIQRHEPFLSRGHLLTGLIDECILDYLISNADRHDYEVFKQMNRSMIIMMDNGKSFGDPFHDEKSLLAPLHQCCKIRSSTWETITKLQYGVLSEVLRTLLSRDPIAPVLTDDHLRALDRRLIDVVNTVRACVDMKGGDVVFVPDDTS